MKVFRIKIKTLKTKAAQSLGLKEMKKAEP